MLYHSLRRGGLFLFLFTSCKKPYSQTVSISPAKFRTSNVPSVENGMLVFQNEEHLSAYLEELDQFLATPENATFDSLSTYDIDEKLDSIEAAYGYTSLRATIEERWEELNEEGWTTTSDIPNDHWMLGSLNRHIFNSNGDIKVGAAIQHLFNKNYVIVIADGNLETLEKAHNLHLSDTAFENNPSFFFDVFSRDTTVQVYNRNETPIDILWKKYKNETLQDTTWSTTFMMERLSGSNPCANSRTFRAFGVSLHAVGYQDEDIFPSGSKIDIWVDWGDGTTSTFPNQLVHRWVWNGPNGWQTNFTWPSTASHTYSSAGTYTMKVKVKRPYHNSWVAESSQSYQVPQNNCTWKAKDNGVVWIYTDNGHQAISTKTQTGTNWIGYTYFEAETKGYHQNSGKFQNRKVYRIVAQLWGDLYHNCGTVYSTVAKADWPYHSKKAQARQGTLANDYSKFEIMYSNHKLEYYKYYNIDRQLISCD